MAGFRPNAADAKKTQQPANAGAAAESTNEQGTAQKVWVDPFSKSFEGRLVADAEARTSTAGKNFVTFTVARTADDKGTSVFEKCIMFGAPAEHSYNTGLMTKGAKVNVMVSQETLETFTSEKDNKTYSNIKNVVRSVGFVGDSKLVDRLTGSGSPVATNTGTPGTNEPAYTVQ